MKFGDNKQDLRLKYFLEKVAAKGKGLDATISNLRDEIYAFSKEREVWNKVIADLVKELSIAKSKECQGCNEDRFGGC